MAIDYFVHWQTEVPSFKEVRLALERYVNDSGTVREETHWLFVELTSHNQDPFGFHEEMKRQLYAPPHDVRCFEVYVDKTGIDVITRFTDEFTNVLARGFQHACARRWNGKLEDP